MNIRYSVLATVLFTATSWASDNKSTENSIVPNASYVVYENDAGIIGGLSSD